MATAKKFLFDISFDEIDDCCASPGREKTHGLFKVEAVTRRLRRGWAIIVHPNVMYRRQEWARLGDRLCIENMDKRKQSARPPAI